MLPTGQDSQWHKSTNSNTKGLEMHTELISSLLLNCLMIKIKSDTLAIYKNGNRKMHYYHSFTTKL